MSGQIGELTEIMGRDMWRRIEQVVNAKSARREPYYILVMVLPGARLTGQGPTYELDTTGKRVVTQRIVIADGPPPVPLLGTILFRVDNRSSRFDLVWALPQDSPNTIEDSENTGPAATAVAESAAKFNVPLIFN